MERMRDLLRTSLRRSLQTLPPEDRLAAALPVVCGPVLGPHCQVSHLDDNGELTLLVEGEPWMEPLLAMRPLLTSDLARVAGVPLRQVHLKLARPASATPQGAAQDGQSFGTSRNTRNLRELNGSHRPNKPRP